MAKKKDSTPLKVPPAHPELGEPWVREDGVKFIWDHKWKKVVK